MDSVLKKRSDILFAIRTFFIKREYIEVETPLRLPSIIPEDHIDPFLSEDFFLQSSPEICMKRLLSSGYDKIFQICKAFRKGERGNLHIPEMTMLEWYRKDVSYFDLMEETRELINYLSHFLKKDSLIFNGKKTYIDSDFDKLSVKDAINHYTSYSYNEVLKNFDEIFGLEICPKLGFKKPVFLHDFPASEASLAKLSKDDDSTAQRFELFISGVEICNCFTELTDSNEQRKRFNETIKYRKSNNKTVSDMPEKFLMDLESMPEASGNALGIDRLIMLLLDKSGVDEVISFTPENL